jgi:drug/metabolite transporter (DMT)-like permease
MASVDMMALDDMQRHETAIVPLTRPKALQFASSRATIRNSSSRALVGVTGPLDELRSDADSLHRHKMTKFVMPAASREDIRRGIIYILLSVFIFGGINAMVKWAATIYPVTEIIFFRCLFSLIPTFVLVAAHGGVSKLRTHRFGEHLARAIMQFMSMVCIFVAYRMMPLADAVAITFASPLFLTVLSIPLLGERVGIHRWGAVLVGFIGVMLIVEPGPGLLESGAIFAIASAFIGASVTVALRRMSLTESSTTLLFYQIMLNLMLSILLLPLGWVTPTWFDGAVMALIGILSGIGQYWWMLAFRYAPASVAAPFSYTSIIWAAMFGYLVWGDVPGIALLGGAIIVVASGLYILYRETVRRVPQSDSQPATKSLD